MWYNDLLLILMGFVALLLIVMTIVMTFNMRNSKKSEELVEKPEPIYVEKGFESEKNTELQYNSTEIDSIDENTEENSVEIEPVHIKETVVSTSEPEDEVVITPIDPIIIEPEPVESVNEEIPDDDVAITPNEILYDTKPEEIPEGNELGSPITKETSKEPVEENIEFEHIPEIELPPLDSNKEEVPKENDPESEPELEPVIPIQEKESEPRKLRKPVIDEDDPALNIDLGVETCPNCGGKVPDTIYCILCGKPLDPENTLGYKEE